MAWRILSLASKVSFSVWKTFHPCLTSINQAIIAQEQRDIRVLNLLLVIHDVYELVLDAEPLKKNRTHKRAVEMLAKQTTECAYFVSVLQQNKILYVSSSTSKKWTSQIITTAALRFAQNMMGSIDTRITALEKSFQSLRRTFVEGVALETELVVLRMISDLETLGKPPYSTLLYQYSIH
jgi:hypothetical protein